MGAPSLETSTVRAPHPEVWCKQPFLPEASSPIINQSPEPTENEPTEKSAARASQTPGRPGTRYWLEPRTLAGRVGRPGWAQSLPHEDRLFKEGPHLRRGLGDAPPTQERQLGRAFARELTEGLSRGRDGQGRLSKKEGGGRPVTGVWGLSSSQTPGNPEKRCKMPRRLRQM